MNKIEEFVNQYPAERTRNDARRILHMYFEIIDADPNTYFSNKKHNYGKDMMTYYTSENRKIKRKAKNGLPVKAIKDLAPLTRAMCVSRVKIFLEDNGVFLQPNVWKRIKRMGGSSHETLTIDAAPTREELKQILQHGETKARALGLLASSSGIRIGAILKLTESDIDFDKDPVRIYLPAAITKNHKPRLTFMSNEAKDAVKAWIKERDDYLDSAVRKSKSLKCGKDPKDERLFPMSDATTNTMWLRLLKKSGLDQKDKSTGFRRLHFHTLRKYFDTNMAAAGIPESVIGCLVGHAGYLDHAYKRFDEGKLADFYKKGVNNLLVFETGEDPEQQEKFEKYKQEQGKKELAMGNKILKLEEELMTVKKQYVQIEGNYRQLNGKITGVEQKVKPFAAYQMQDILMNTDIDAFMHEFYNNPEFKEKIRKILEGIKKKVEEMHKQQTRLEITCSL